jgi:hypothetical protein
LGYRKYIILFSICPEKEVAPDRILGITDYNIQTLMINQYNNVFASLVVSANIELIEDIWNGVWGIYMSDMVPPNAIGYQKMADNYFNRIKTYLQNNNLVK